MKMDGWINTPNGDFIWQEDAPVALPPPVTLEDALSRYNQSNFDFRYVAASMRKIAGTYGISDLELIAVVPVFGEYHKAAYQSGYTEGSDYATIAAQGIKDAMLRKGLPGYAWLSTPQVQAFIAQGAQEMQTRWQATQKSDSGFGSFGIVGLIAAVAAAYFTGGASLAIEGADVAGYVAAEAVQDAAVFGASGEVLTTPMLNIPVTEFTPNIDTFAPQPTDVSEIVDPLSPGPLETGLPSTPQWPQWPQLPKLPIDLTQKLLNAGASKAISAGLTLLVGAGTANAHSPLTAPRLTAHNEVSAPNIGTPSAPSVPLIALFAVAAIFALSR